MAVEITEALLRVELRDRERDGRRHADRIERRRVECGQPRDNIRLLQRWDMGSLDVTTRESRYGSFCSFTLLPQDDQTYGGNELWRCAEREEFRRFGTVDSINLPSGWSGSAGC